MNSRKHHHDDELGSLKRRREKSFGQQQPVNRSLQQGRRCGRVYKASAVVTEEGTPATGMCVCRVLCFMKSGEITSIQIYL